MIMLKVQQWRPDTHAGHIVEVEWEYDAAAGRDTGREHRGVSVRYPDGTFIHRDTHGPEEAHQHFTKLLAEHVVKNQAFRIIMDSLPNSMRKPVVDSDGDAVLDTDGQPKLAVKDKHRPQFEHLGDGRYKFIVPGMDDATRHELTAKLSQFGDGIVTLQSA